MILCPGASGVVTSQFAPNVDTCCHVTVVVGTTLGLKYRSTRKLPFTLAVPAFVTVSVAVAVMIAAFYLLRQELRHHSWREIRAAVAKVPGSRIALAIGLTAVNYVWLSGYDALALRSFLRQDPDIIMVGEMRDLETAEIAIESSLTGHLVLSTLHTNDCPSTPARLLDMGIPPFLVSSSLQLILAQRPGRRVCRDCKEPYEATEESLVPYGHVPQGLGTINFYKGKGCQTCNFTGMKGRVAIYEVMPISTEIRDLIHLLRVVHDPLAILDAVIAVPPRRHEVEADALDGQRSINERIEPHYYSPTEILR